MATRSNEGDKEAEDLRRKEDAEESLEFIPDEPEEELENQEKESHQSILSASDTSGSSGGLARNQEASPLRGVASGQHRFNISSIPPGSSGVDIGGLTKDLSQPVQHHERFTHETGIPSASISENVSNNTKLQIPLQRGISTTATIGSTLDGRINSLDKDTGTSVQEEVGPYNVTLDRQSFDSNCTSAIVDLQARQMEKYNLPQNDNITMPLQSELSDKIKSLTDTLEHINVQSSDGSSGDVFARSVQCKDNNMLQLHENDEWNGSVLYGVEEMKLPPVRVKDTDLPPKYQYTMFYDGAFIHSGDQDDKNVALTLCEEIEDNVTLTDGLKPRLYLMDRDKDLGRSKIDESGNAVSNSTYKFVILSNKLTEDKWSNMLKDEAIMGAIEQEDLQWSVIPIHTGKKGEYEIPFGLKALNAIEKTSRGRFFFQNLTKVFNKKLYVREEREKKFNEEKDKVIEAIRLEKERELRERRHRELMERKRKENEKKLEQEAYRKDANEVDQHLKEQQTHPLDTVEAWKQSPSYQPQPYQLLPTGQAPAAPRPAHTGDTYYVENVGVLQPGQFNTAYTGQGMDVKQPDPLSDRSKHAARKPTESIDNSMRNQDDRPRHSLSNHDEAGKARAEKSE